MKKLFISIAIATTLGQFLGSIVTKSGTDAPRAANSESCMGVRCLPFFSYI